MKRIFTPNDIKHFDYLSHPSVSKDGKLIAYTVMHAEEEGGSFPSSVWLFDTESCETRRLTPDCVSWKDPVFVDGRLLYLSNEEGEYQIFSRDLMTGSAERLTSLRHGVNRFSASENDALIAFEATLWPEDIENGIAFDMMTAEEKAAWEKQLDMRPYFVTELMYKMDEWYGMRKGEFSHIGTVNIDGTEQRLIDTNGMEATYPSVSNGRLAFYGYPHSGPKGRSAELFACTVGERTPKQLTDGLTLSADTPPVIAENGVIFCAYPELEDGGISLLPFIANESGEVKPLMDADDETVCHGVNPCVCSRTVMGETPYMYLSADGKTLLFLTAFRGQSKVCAVPVSGGKAEPVLDGDADIQCFSLDKNDRPVAVTGGTTAPGELWYGGKTVTAHNAWLNEFERAYVEKIDLTSRDGVTRIQYFLVHPAGEKPGETYPAVLDIKGGPTTMYAAAYWHELHALASAGFYVICPNPRGSVGFGRAYCAGPICWKNEAMEDIIDCLEDAIKKGCIDRERVGVTGGSYGGYMTNKLIGRTKLFKAAVSQRCLINPAVSYGTGDLGFINHGSVPKDFTMLAYLEDRARGNLITYIDNIDIPVLILHGYRDYRCGFEQAEQFFIAMKDRHPDTPVRLVMFPNENHGVTREGKLHSQIRHLSELVNWFRKYLKGEDIEND